jgi:hypothetical protein
MAIRRAIAAARKEGLPIAATTVAPDGTVTIHHQGVAPPVVPAQDMVSASSEWEDFEA